MATQPFPGTALGGSAIRAGPDPLPPANLKRTSKMKGGGARVRSAPGRALSRDSPEQLKSGV
ncbi:hypothetical protein C8Q79DRAFT_960965 [Trametes meyenii]|nr:hypothetical protein C8Q79DRAFT_960965 [Trametes meyenii]